MSLFLFQIHFLSRIGGDSLNSMTVSVLRRAIIDDLAQHYTWLGTKDKKSFSELTLSRVIVCKFKFLIWPTLFVDTAHSFFKLQNNIGLTGQLQFKFK